MYRMILQVVMVVLVYERTECKSKLLENKIGSYLTPFPVLVYCIYPIKKKRHVKAKNNF